jgi:hypothetical protein
MPSPCAHGAVILSIDTPPGGRVRGENAVAARRWWLDRATGELGYSSCGQPLVAGCGRRRVDPVPPRDRPPTHFVPREPVLLYSDRLVERPHRTIDNGMAELAKVAADAAVNRVLPLGAAPSQADRVCHSGSSC